MCVIADAASAGGHRRRDGRGGHRGLRRAPRDVLVEAAEFDPVSIRTTARRLSLHSDSSYRFERRVDPEGVDWASRRCCELILELAGGELAAGVVDVGRPPAAAAADRAAAVPNCKRILGIDVRRRERVRRDPRRPGQRRGAAAALTGPRARRRSITVVPPSWRPRPDAGDRPGGGSRPHPRLRQDPRGRGRADGPLGPHAARTAWWRRSATCSRPAGFDEAMTLSVVDEASARAFSPWTDAEPLRSLMPVHPRGRPAADQPGAQPAGRAADQRGPGQPGDRAVRDRQGLSARRATPAGGAVDAGL